MNEMNYQRHFHLRRSLSFPRQVAASGLPPSRKDSLPEVRSIAGKVAVFTSKTVTFSSKTVTFSSKICELNHENIGFIQQTVM